MKFVDYTWKPYGLLKLDKNAKMYQTSLLVGSELCEGNDGIEHAFVPTKSMSDLEKTALDLCSGINIEDHEVSICDEVFFTSKIEGAKTTIARTQEIHDGSPVSEDNAFSENMLRGGFRATKLMSLHANKVTPDVMIEVWEVLTEGCRHNEAAQGERFRTGNVQVGNHVGLHPDVIEETMSLWCDYYNSTVLDDHPFIKAALLHYGFEYAHPFCDGNGRMGRLLMNAYLISRGFDSVKAVSFSKTIDKSRAAYDAAFEFSENSYCDCTPFIEYMLGVYAESFYDALEKTLSNEQLQITDQI